MNKITHFHQPSSLEEALHIKITYGKQSAFISGGTEINSLDFKQSYSHIISLEGILTDTVSLSEHGLEIGANCSFQELIKHPKVPESIVQACLLIASRNIRNRVTVGGHIGSNHPNGVLLPVLLALNTSVKLAAKGAIVPLATLMNSREPSLVMSIVIPVTDLQRSCAITHFRRSANDRCILVAAASLHTTKQQMKKPLIALAGVDDTVLRLFDLEEALEGKNLPDLSTIETQVSSIVHPKSSIQCSSQFKKHLAGVLVAQAIKEAASAGGVS